MKIIFNVPLSDLTSATTKIALPVYIKTTLSDGIWPLENTSKVDLVVCTIATYTAPFVQNISYFIGKTEDITMFKSTTIAAWTQKDAAGESCGFSETFTVTPSDSSWISQNGRTVTIVPGLL